MKEVQAIIKRFRLNDKGSKPLCLSQRYDRYHLAQFLTELGYSVGAEIGVRRGNYSKFICDNNPNIKMYCIDPWAPYNNKYTEKKQNAIYEEAVKNLEGRNVEIIRKNSFDALADFKDESLDFVFIDGDHTFDYAAPDIIYWSRKVRSGGLVMVHDCYSWSGAGVLQAVYAYTHCHNLFWFVTKENEPTAFWVKP